MTPFVGREAELATLVSARRAAARGRGSLVLIGGPPGIGKSRLLQAFGETLTHGRTLHGTGVCREPVNLPYAPVLDALRSVTKIERPLPPERARQLSALCGAIESAARKHTVVLYIEDVHHGDEATIALLRYLMPALGSIRALVVATHRTAGPANAAWRAALAQFLYDDSVTAVELKPLDAQQTRTLVRSLQPQLSPERADAVAERSRGNPFLARELCSTAGNDDAIPPAAQALVNARLDALSESDRAIAECGAVAGICFRMPLLAAASGKTAKALVPALRRIRDAGIVEPGGDRPQSYTFVHGLYRDAIYTRLLPEERRPIHARIVAALERSRASDARELAYHSWAMGDARRALRYSECAARQAEAEFDRAEAERCYLRAADYARPAKKGALLGNAASCALLSGKPERACGLFERAAAAHFGVGDSSSAAKAFCSASAAARSAGFNERATRILQDARALLPERSEAAALIASTLAVARLDRADDDSARELLAFSRSSASGERVTYTELRASCYQAMMRADVVAFSEDAAKIVRLSESMTLEDLARSQFNQAFGHCVLGEDELAAMEFEALLPQLRDGRFSGLETLACANLALVRARTGILDEAAALVRRAMAIPNASGTAPVVLAAAALTVGRALGDAELIRPVPGAIVESAFESGINTTIGRFAGPYARVLFETGDTDGARRTLDRAVQALACRTAATETLIAAAELGEERTAAAALDLAVLQPHEPPLPLHEAAALHVRAVIGARRGEPAAIDLAREAMERYETLRWPLHAAECATLCGETERAFALLDVSGAVGQARRLTRRTAALRRTGLSRREWEIAELVARGSSNADLASRLAISPRTVEKHLTAIYRKLGFRSRSELAAFSAAHAPLR